MDDSSLRRCIGWKQLVQIGLVCGLAACGGSGGGSSESPGNEPGDSPSHDSEEDSAATDENLEPQHEPATHSMLWLASPDQVWSLPPGDSADFASTDLGGATVGALSTHANGLFVGDGPTLTAALLGIDLEAAAVWTETPADDSITRLLPVPDVGLWAVTKRDTLIAMDFAGDTLAVSEPGDALIDLVLAPAAAPNDVIGYSLHEDRVVARGLDAGRVGEFDITAFGMSSPTALATGAEDRLWLLEQDALHALDLDGEPVSTFALPANRYNRLKADGHGGTWLIGGHHLRRIDADGATRAQHELVAIGHVDPVLVAAVGPVEGDLWFVAGTRLVHAAATGDIAVRREIPDHVGTESLTDLWLYADTHDPELEFTDPDGEAWTNQTDPEIRLAWTDIGLGVDPSTLDLRVDDAVIPAQDCSGTSSTVLGAARTGSIECRLPTLADGEYELSAEARDRADNPSESAMARLHIDTHPPEIHLDPDIDGAWTDADEVVLAGSISEPGELIIDGASVALDIDHAFVHSVALDADGTHVIDLTATDRAGNTATRTATVHRATVPPDAPVADRIMIEADEDGMVQVRADSGAVPGSGTVHVRNLRTGDSATVIADDKGSFTVALAGLSTDTVAASTRDPVGNESEPSYISGVDTPADPAGLAPPLPATGTPPLAAQVEFLYAGDDPLQREVSAGAIEPGHVAMIRGRVRTRGEDPLPGVRIRIQGRPELGHAVSRADGRFDLAVNGGGGLTLVYEKAGYLPAQRTVDTAWNEWHTADDVVLIPPDERVTPIDLTDTSEPFQVARGTAVSDEAGERQATLLFPAGTEATYTNTNGDVETLEQLDVRATEYTVGEAGPETMPAPLPANSAYTYAVEFSVDQLLGMNEPSNGRDITFSQPVPFYIDNFLDFPVGELVPTGFLDRSANHWQAHDDGRVIEVVAVEDGIAQLDVTGDGNIDEGEALADLGIGVDERRQLANLYEPGDSLWRVALDHFSAWDCNWPYGPPSSAGPPNVPLPQPAPDQEQDSSEEDECEGCVISPQRGSLGKSIDIAGTPYSLHYQSDRAEGYARSEIEIPVTGSELPADLQSVELTIEIAGRRIHESFEPEPNQTHAFAWDGYDAWGRQQRAAAKATVRLSYVYECQYLAATPGARRSSFARFGAVASPIGTRDRCQGFTFPRAHTLVVPPPTRVSSPAGNWTLSSVHRLTVDSGDLLLGDGQRNRLPQGIIDTVAGTGARQNSGDGGPAREAGLYRPTDVAVASDGTAYIAQTSGPIRRISPDGIISTLTTVTGGAFSIALDPDERYLYVINGRHSIRKVSVNGGMETVAGTGVSGFSGDGGPAVEARIGSATGLSVDADGTIYFSDSSNARIRRITTDGIIETVAGTGERASTGDGGPAIEAALDSPFGTAIDANGNVYIAEAGSSRIRRIRADGIVETVAGSGTFGSSGDGGPPLEAELSWPGGLAVDAAGSIYVSEGVGGRIRRVIPDRVISTVAGTGAWGFEGDGGAAENAVLASPDGMAFTPDGAILFADVTNHRIRKITPEGGLLRLADGEIAVASEDGQRHYVFDSSGLHLRTQDAHTGSVILHIDRNEDGHVIALSDGDDNVTRIERDRRGAATSIIAPNGQRTFLTIHDDDYLISVINPLGAEWSMAYTHDGLLTHYDHPGIGAYSFTYDDDGRLLGDTNPVGGGWQLARTTLNDGYQTDMTTAEGRVHRFSVERTGTNRSEYNREYPDGTRSRRTHSAMEARLERRDGTRSVVEYAPDPVYGMSTRYAESREIVLPSGLTHTRTMERNAELLDPADPLGLKSLEVIEHIGTRSTRTHFDAADLLWATESAAGRDSTVRTDSQGRPVEQKPAGMAAITTTYDERGRPDSVVQGEGESARTMTFTYHAVGEAVGYLATITDALGRETRFEHDAAGRVTEQVLPGGSIIGYQYDLAGNLQAITPPGRSAHVFVHDGIGQRTEYDPPDLDGIDSVTRYRYNLDRQLTTIERPDGETVMLDYDAGGRLSERTTDAGTVTHGYDATTGQLISLDAPGNIGLIREYDGFLPTAEEWVGPVSGRVARTWDSNFWLAEETVAGSSVTFEHDPDGLVTAAGNLDLERHAQHGGVASTALHDVHGTRGYNAFGELAERGVEHLENVLYSATYSRDPLGRITSKTETVDGDNIDEHYVYDEAGRLTEVHRDGVPVHLYTYDANGNRIRHTGPAGTVEGEYDEQDRLLAYGDISYQYNAAGDLVSQTSPAGTTTYDYDAVGNLRGVELADDSKIDYLIDGRDRRVGKKVDGELTKGWLYRDQLNPVAQIDREGNVTHRFVYAEQKHVPAYMIATDPATGDEREYRFIVDHIGSVRLVVNAGTGEVAQRIDYDPFGRITTDTNPGFQPFGFAGGLHDQDTGLVRFGARDYDPKTGRWTAKDPIDFAGGDANLFGYSFNDSINFHDPNGQFAVTGTVVAAIAIRAAVGAASSAVGTKMPGGSNAEAARNAVIGGVAGAVIPGGSTLTRAAAINAGTGAGGSTISQVATIANDPCLGARDFNVGAVTGSAVGGALSARANAAGAAMGGNAVIQSVSSATGAGRATVISGASGAIGGSIGAQ